MDGAVIGNRINHLIDDRNEELPKRTLVDSPNIICRRADNFGNNTQIAVTGILTFLPIKSSIE